MAGGFSFENEKTDFASFGGAASAPEPKKPARKPTASRRGENEVVSTALVRAAEVLSADMMSFERDKRLKEMADQVFIFRFQAGQVERSYGFDLPERLREGRTVQGKVAGTDREITVRFPADRNEELDGLSPGAEVDVEAAIGGWDTLYHRLLMNAL